MNRRFRRLLAGGLLGAAASMLMGWGRRRRGPALEKSLGQRVGPMFRSFMGMLTKEGFGQKLFSLRKRVK